jgi:hypothetical protein
MPAPEDLTVTLTPDIENGYRVDFQTTEDDGEASKDQSTQQLAEVLSESDWSRVYDIQITGSASAEDEAQGGGFQADSEKNTNLALQRALLAAKPVIDSFAEKGIDVHKPVEKVDGEAAEAMIQVTGVEDSWSDEDMTTASGLAERFGYDSVEQMVEFRNDGKPMPPAVDEFLKPLLDDKRGAEIVLKLRGDDGGERTVLVSVDRERVVVTETTRDVVTKDIVSNNVIGNLPEEHQIPAPGPDGDENKPPVTSPVVALPPETTPVPPQPPKPPRPWEDGPKDAAFRQKQRAPQGNGARPLRYGGGVPYNPTPANYPR